MRVLLVEDDQASRLSLSLMLRSDGFNVFAVDLGEEALELGKAYEYELIILDVGLPDVSGLDVLKQLRASRVSTPIMILSGLGDIDVKVQAFRCGADEYLTKPVFKDELIARANAVVRRSRGHAQPVISAGALEVDLEQRLVTMNGHRVYLTGKEFQILELLALKKGKTVTKEGFLNHIYGGQDEPEMKIIDVFICKLRKKLAASAEGLEYIETVWGRGYILREPLSVNGTDAVDISSQANRLTS